jgi:hypothetical protein
VSGFALLPALVLVLMTEALGIRSVLAYALGGAVVGLCAYLSLVPFDSDERCALPRSIIASSR